MAQVHPVAQRILKRLPAENLHGALHRLRLIVLLLELKVHHAPLPVVSFPVVSDSCLWRRKSSFCASVTRMRMR